MLIKDLTRQETGCVFIVEPARPQYYPEMLLLAAMLRRAAHDITFYRGAQRLDAKKWWKDAHDWMFNEDDVDHSSKEAEDRRFDIHMSFRNVCRMLNIDPNTTRLKTLRLTKKDVRKYDMVDTYGRLY